MHVSNEMINMNANQNCVCILLSYQILILENLLQRLHLFQINDVLEHIRMQAAELGNEHDFEMDSAVLNSLPAVSGGYCPLYFQSVDVRSFVNLSSDPLFTVITPYRIVG